MNRPVFRFAPSPNGLLHLGHAYSALLNARMAGENGGCFLLRIEDIDTARCTPELEKRMIDDLHWLGLSWEEPVRRQSQHFADYQTALDVLIEAGLVYPAFMSRGEVRARIEERMGEGGEWPHDPDGVPLYPEDERTMSQSERRRRIADGEPFAWRLDVPRAMIRYGRNLFWDESGAGPEGETGRIAADPARWGDVVIARKETPTSYHLSVVIDDALQGITHVVRGRDLFHATAVHRLLQEILGLPVPLYHHHDLIVDEHGRKLSKSRGDTALAALRQAGLQPEDIRRQVGL
ncbi:tRNA glutamyl-Q(34) synthetase GluQRS [Phyllobacterium salinisoli]|uniref:tRNA glutamyl-Q(34) synthetase GluQRS n=1 Tax=Phyllobacterium salinisoli TaxID=1899321 RepID=A0A368K5Y3_9HYPH|nr:tRNA glutamyl-Q(34) synthetase GluQRS [Phyllobacterium salinisoli]RCS24045.1 tRNA glutamyl-Q(34) synthetase GluQRS [Phyllobacterium salinisoli]